MNIPAVVKARANGYTVGRTMIERLIKRRVSTRTFNGEGLDEGLIHELIEAAKYAPSGKNRQPWKVKILDGKEKMRLGDLLEERRQGLEDYGSLKLSIAAIRGCDRGLFICNPFSYTERPYPRNRLLMDTQSIGAFIQNLLLCLTERDIASLWINDIYYAKEVIEAAFSLPHELIAALAIGKSDAVRTFNTPRLSLKEILLEGSL